MWQQKKLRENEESEKVELTEQLKIGASDELIEDVEVSLSAGVSRYSRLEKREGSVSLTP